LSNTKCKHVDGTAYKHRYDQSAMVIVLSFYFFPSPRHNDNTDPAPYDMYTSIQQSLAEVKRRIGEKDYFTRRKNLKLQQNSSITTVIKQ
ncbi:unnamed protein product, partial [Rotaria sp. Silwood2]